MPISAGAQLGRYKVIELIGAGGMGEVYRAHDGSLGRIVALKILPEEVTSDTARRARFEHEGRALAALNHPNIVNVYDVGTQDGMPYIVTELVTGQPLRGKLAVASAIDAARQISNGLAAAHAAGVIHRDLKPDNILRMRDGHLKILDFGLAKFRGRATVESDDVETETLKTRPGLIVGTVGYMSPEQVRGEEADARSDLFNLGLILHEMLSGKRAFVGATSIETLHAILKDNPAELPDTVPVGLRQIVARCLEKDRAERFQSARDLEFALALFAAQDSGTASPGGQGKRVQHRPVVWLAGTVLLLAAGILAGHLLWRDSQPKLWAGVAVGGPEQSYSPQLSPNGHTLAMVGIVNDCGQPVVMTPETGNYAVLSHDKTHGYAHSVTWSPDGSLLYFARLVGGPAGVFSVPALGGEERIVLPDAAAPRAVRDGSLLVNRMNGDRRFQIYRFWPESGRLDALPFLLNDEARYARTVAVPFPDGKEALIYGVKVGTAGVNLPHLYVLELATGKSRQLPAELDQGFYGMEVSPNGTILLSRRRGQLFEVAAVARSGALPAQVLFTSTIPLTVLSGASDGSIYADQEERSSEVIRFSVQGGPVEIVARIAQIGGASLAVLRDGRGVVGSVLAGRTHLVAVEKGKSPADLLTTTEQVSTPVAASATELALVLGPPLWDSIGVASLSTGRITRRIAAAKGPITALAFSPGGDIIYFGAGGFIWKVDAAGRIERLMVGDSVAVGRDFLAVRSRENGTQHLFRAPLSGGAAIEVEHGDPLHNLIISPNALKADGQILTSLAPVDSWWFPPALTGKSGRLERIPIDYQGDIHSMGWTPDGKVLALTQVLRMRIWKFSPESR